MNRLKTIIFEVGDTYINVAKAIPLYRPYNLNFIVAVSSADIKTIKTQEGKFFNADLTDEELVNKKLDSIKKIIAASHLVFVISSFNDEIDFVLAHQVASLVKNSLLTAVIGIVPNCPMIYTDEEKLNYMRSKVNFILFLNNYHISVRKTIKDELSISSKEKGINFNKLFDCIQGVTGILTENGLVSLQFDDIRLLLSDIVISESIEIVNFDNIFSDA